jgi:TonB family protein
VRAATGPIAPPDVGALVSTPLRRSTGELPAGTFNYPVKHSGPNKLVWLLAGLAVLSVGFVVVVFVFPKLQGNSATPAPVQKPETVAVAPADAAVVPPVPDEPPPPPDVDVSLDPTPQTGSGKRPTPTPATNPTGTRPPRGGTTAQGLKNGAGSAATTPGSGGGSDEDTVENAPNNPQPDADACDEVSCVLAKYDRPCCEKYRPKDSDIKPRTAGGIPAELDKAMVRAGIEKVKPRVVACGERASDKGTVKVSVSVRPDGTVSNLSLVASPNPELGDCVVAAMKKAEFGKSVAGGSFVYPFVF